MFAIRAVTAARTIFGAAKSPRQLHLASASELSPKLSPKDYRHKTSQTGMIGSIKFWDLPMIGRVDGISMAKIGCICF